MIKYNKLQISGNYLIIDFEIEDKPYYEGVLIKGVQIDTQFTYKITDTSPLVETAEEGSTRFTAEIFIPDIKKELLIITPLVTPLKNDTPCGKDIVDMAAIYDKSLVLDKGMIFLSDLGDTCNLQKPLIDFILKHKALDMAIETCNYSAAIKYWKMLIGNKGTVLKGCGCNGRY